MHLSNSADQFVVLASCRWCLSRDIESVSTYTTWLLEHWHQLSSTMHVLIVRDILTTIVNRTMTRDVEWYRFIKEIWPKLPAEQVSVLETELLPICRIGITELLGLETDSINGKV